MTGYTGMFYDYGKGYYGHGFDFEYTDNITWVKNRHTFKFGAMATTYKSYGPNPQRAAGHLQLPVGSGPATRATPPSRSRRATPTRTSCWVWRISPVPDRRASSPASYWAWDTEFYAQDTWQASKKMTIYYGVRYMYETPWNWQNGYSTYWDPATNKLAPAAGFRHGQRAVPWAPIRP